MRRTVSFVSWAETWRDEAEYDPPIPEEATLAPMGTMEKIEVMKEVF